MTAVHIAPDLRVTAVLREIRDAQLRERTLALFEEVRLTRPDVVVLAARRLACVYSTLVEAGLEPFDCAVFSDRDFEFAADSFAGATIALVDDSLVVGSTLGHLHRMLSRMVGRQGRVTVHVACVDESQSSVSILDHLGLAAAPKVSSRRISEYSHDLARLLFRNLMPYVGDFLVGPRVLLSVANLPSILSLPGWVMADVTSPQVADESTLAYSFIPMPALSAGARADMLAYAPSLADVDVLFKVRAFVRMTGFTAEIRLVPIAVLSEMPVSLVQRAISELMRSVADDYYSEMLALETNAASATRVLQAFSASRIGARFAEALPIAHDTTDAFIDQPLARINFGPALHELVLAVSALPMAERTVDALGEEGSGIDDYGRSTEIQTSLVGERHAQTMVTLIREIIASVGVPARPTSGCTVFPGQVPVGLIGHWFSFVDGAYERPERAKLRGLSWDEFCKMYPDPATRRLNQGITLSALGDMIPGADREWARYLASLAVDVCNDTGVAVPATLVLGGQVVRTYRLGENSYLASFPFAYTGVIRARSEDVTDRTAWLMPRFRTLVESWDASSLGPAPSKEDLSVLRSYAADVRVTAQSALDDVASI